MMIDRHQLDGTVAQLEAESDEIFAEILATRLAPLAGLERLAGALEAAAIPKAIATSSRRSFTQTVLGRFDFEPRFRVPADLRGRDARETASGDLPDRRRNAWACRRRRCWSWKTARTAAAPRPPPGPSRWRCPGPQNRHHDFPGVAFIADSLADDRIYAALGLGA